MPLALQVGVPCRTLCAHAANNAADSFIVGTNDLKLGARNEVRGQPPAARCRAPPQGRPTAPRGARQPGHATPQVRFIEHDGDNNALRVKRCRHEAGEVWSVAASPSDRQVVATAYRSAGQAGVALWRTGPAEQQACTLARLADYRAEGGGWARQVAWNPCDSSVLCVAEGRRLAVLRVRDHGELQVGAIRPPACRCPA